MRLLNNDLPTPCVMIRKKAIEAVGGYDESLFYEDFDMWLRLSARFRFVFLPATLVRYRVHRESMSRSRRNGKAICSSRTRILSKWLGADLDSVIRNQLLDTLLWCASMIEAKPGEPSIMWLGTIIGMPGARWRESEGYRVPAPLRLMLPLYRLNRAWR